MCYEVFNRSAADSFLRSARRERLLHEKERGGTGLPSETETLQQSLNRISGHLKETLPPLDWKEGVRQAREFAFPYRKPLWTLAGVLAALALFFWSASGHWWTRVVGLKPVYRFADHRPVRYLLTFSSDFKAWSERSENLDTALSHVRIDELGNFELRAAAQKKSKRLEARAREWIVIQRDTTHGTQQSAKIPISHPSLKGGSLALDAKGRISERNFPSNVRMGRALHFLTPDWPAKRLTPGDTWTSSVSWVEQIQDWKVFWSGSVDWTFNGVQAGNADVLTFSGRMHVKPHIWDSPPWAKGQTKAARFSAPPGEAFLVFDARHGRVSERRMAYRAHIDFPLNDLARIPWELRVGRRVRGPGRIVLDFSNRIDLRQN